MSRFSILLLLLLLAACARTPAEKPRQRQIDTARVVVLDTVDQMDEPDAGYDDPQGADGQDKSKDSPEDPGSQGN